MTDAFERAAEHAEAEIRKQHRERLAGWQRKGFRIHATVFIAVQILLIVVWALQWQIGGGSYPWFVYPLLGWGVGLAAHYAAIRESFQSGRSR